MNIRVKVEMPYHRGLREGERSMYGSDGYRTITVQLTRVPLRNESVSVGTERFVVNHVWHLADDPFCAAEVYAYDHTPER